MFKAFISHSRHDKDFCNAFDNACASVGLARFRSEFEDIEKPAWKTINREIKKSNALFVLIGEQLRKRQSNSLINNPKYTDWLFTQNWISYEIGFASQRRIDVWVVSDSPDINFPVIYLNNYYLWEGNLEKPEQRDICQILKAYSESRGIKFDNSVKFTCPNPECKASYNIPQVFPKGYRIRCPTCLRILEFSDGWLLSKNYPFQDHVRIIEEKNKTIEELALAPAFAVRSALPNGHAKSQTIHKRI
jgi:hypothetical protein